METNAKRHPVLRASRWLYAKSPYAIDVNPWVPCEDAEAALLLRGAIVSAYASVETRLAELSLRIARMDAYSKLRDSYPHAVGKRLAFLRRAFGTSPLDQFESIALSFFKRFEEAADLRHFMAHSRMEMVGDSTGWGITFHDYRGVKGGVTYRRHRITLPDLERHARRSVRLSRLAQRLITRLNETALLPPTEM